MLLPILINFLNTMLNLTKPCRETINCEIFSNKKEILKNAIKQHN